MPSRSRQRALVEAGIALTSELDLDAILDKLVATAAQLTGARYAALGVLSGDHSHVQTFVSFGLTEAEREAIGAPPYGRGILGALITDPRPLRLHDLSKDPRSVGFPPDHPPMRSFLGVPVSNRGVIYGNLYLTEKESGDFTEEDEELTILLAAQAAVAIGNARRVERDVLARVVETQETERRRLARELHDGTGQALTSILLGLSSVEHAPTVEAAREAASQLRGLVVATLQDVRQLSVELRPKTLDDFGLDPALRRLGQTVRETTGLDVQVETRVGSARLASEVETAIYRIVQESVSNVLRHAAASHISIVATRRDDRISLVVEDDGRGFDTSLPAEGMGLEGMRERVSLLDGTIEIDSAPGHGTTIVVELPAGRARA
ncbi:MAG: GAF domain-containing sensor histidine kinase [Gaiellales bacterium]